MRTFVTTMYWISIITTLIAALFTFESGYFLLALLMSFAFLLNVINYIDLKNKNSTNKKKLSYEKNKNKKIALNSLPKEEKEQYFERASKGYRLVNTKKTVSRHSR